MIKVVNSQFHNSNKAEAADRTTRLTAAELRHLQNGQSRRRSKTNALSDVVKNSLQSLASTPGILPYPPPSQYPHLRPASRSRSKKEAIER
ncbi:hypothetical protein BaRGS_00004404 [Batillaria attramentaria]|uniref:Uncharacterized protein n=1 Tax=Batillaria attramentaria TaxID=370345 RepID=A0ABD0LZH4_9CAEN